MGGEETCKPAHLVLLSLRVSFSKGGTKRGVCKQLKLNSRFSVSNPVGGSLSILLYVGFMECRFSEVLVIDVGVDEGEEYTLVEGVVYRLGVSFLDFCCRICMKGLGLTLSQYRLNILLY